MMQQKHFTIENAKNCDVSATVQQIATKFNGMTLNVSLKYTAVKKIEFQYSKMADSCHLKNRKNCNIMMMQNGSQACRPSTVLDR